jgi:hypothetical protein
MKSAALLFLASLGLCLALPVSFSSNAQAQNSPQASATLLENAQIRVRELRLPPGANLAPESRPNTFLYALTDGAIVFTPPGRKGYELIFKAGEALWLPSQETATANEGEKEVRALVVEIRGQAPAARRGRPAKSKGAPKAAPKSAPKAAPKTTAPKS